MKLMARRTMVPHRWFRGRVTRLGRVGTELMGRFGQSAAVGIDGV
jgi:hypothetical protein